MKKAQNVPLPASSCIEWARYEPSTEKLLVKFHSSGVRYVYEDVRLELVKAWVKHSRKGGSVGSFFITEIKARHNFYYYESSSVRAS